MDLCTYNLQEIGLAKALIRKGHICDVMYCCGEEEEHIQTIVFDQGRMLNILWLRSRKWSVFLREGIYPSLKKYIDRYDVIQVSEYVGLTSLWLNRKYPDKTINYQGPYYCAENHGDIKKAALFDRFILPLQHKKNMVVVTKSVLATEYMESKGIPNVTTIGVGLDLDSLQRDNEGIYAHEFIQKLHNEKGNNKYLLYIGVLEPRRNTLFLLEIFQKVLIEYPDTKLILIGKGKSDYVKQCMVLIHTLGIEDRVIYRDQMDQKYLRAVYEVSDAFVLPTRYEIFGMVLLEAMYFGLPTITTYNGGSSTLMDESNGVVIKDMNSDIWSKKIIELLKNDEVRHAIGEAAHRTIAENYTWDSLADKFLEAYNRRLQSRK